MVVVRGVVMLPEVVCAAIQPLAAQCPRGDGLWCGRRRQKWILLVHLQVVTPATHTPTGVSVWQDTNWCKFPYLILDPDKGNEVCSLNAYLWALCLSCVGMGYFKRYIFWNITTVYNICHCCKDSTAMLTFCKTQVRHPVLQRHLSLYFR